MYEHLPNAVSLLGDEKAKQGVSLGSLETHVAYVLSTFLYEPMGLIGVKIISWLIHDWDVDGGWLEGNERTWWATIFIAK